MYHLLDTFIGELPKRQPLTYRALYPKRILPPNGYLNPKYFSITMYSSLRVWLETDMRMLPHITGFVNALIQMEYRVPTYFVRSEFAQAVAQTEPPEDFKFSEIHWPLPAMLFVLPTDFVLRYFGFNCPFISVTKSMTGLFPALLRNIPKMEVPIEAYEPIQNQVDRFNMVYPVYGTDHLPVDYTGSYPLALNVNEMPNARFEDATYMEEASLDRVFGTSGGWSARNAPDTPAEGEQEKVFTSKIQSFAVKLMLVLNACHDVIKLGGVARPEKVKGRAKRVLEELWHPNLLGWDYKAQRVSPATGEHGTHASPRMHWRRGHMRNQPFGPKPWTEASPKRITWIEPVLINSGPVLQPV